MLLSARPHHLQPSVFSIKSFREEDPLSVFQFSSVVITVKTQSFVHFTTFYSIKWHQLLRPQALGWFGFFLLPSLPITVD